MSSANNNILLINRSTSNLMVLPICIPPVQIECTIALWVWRIVAPVLLTLGTCGNILSIVVLSRRRLRAYATTIYLLFLAFTDLAFLWTSVTRGFFLRFSMDVKNTCSFICVVQEWFAHTTAAFSAWLIALLTIERMLFTMFPVFAREKISRRKTTVVIVTALFAMALFNGHLLFLFQFEKVSVNEMISETTGNETMPNDHHVFVCSPIPGNLKAFVVNSEWRLLVMIFYNIITLIIIVTGNIAIALKLLIEKKKRMLRVHPETQRSTILDERRNAAAKMVFFLCIFFLLTTMPYTSFGLIKSVYFSNVADAKVYARLQLTHAVVIMFLYSNYTFNFLLYFMCGSLFKTEIRAMLAAAKNRCASI